MLTKDLVQATVRNGKLFPKFIKSDDEVARAEAREMCELFADASGRVVSDLEEDVKGSAGSPRKRGFAKLLMDQCDIAEPDDQILEMRWRVFSVSERLRLDPGLTRETFAQGVASAMGTTIDELKDRLFADLPGARSIGGFTPRTPEQIINSYNLSHVTTFLCFAESVSVTLSGLSIGQKRELMRRLKFHRLMSDVDCDKDANTITLELSGPLRLFGKTQGYALRVANFFPFVASLPEWKLDAVITWRGKKVNLSLDQKCGVTSESSRSHGGYVPKEFEQVMSAINDSGELRIEPGSEFIHLGRQSYCFPDFVATAGKTSYAIELFHPWHKGQLQHRIDAARRVNAKGLLLGVERSLLKDPKLREFCDSDPWFAEHGFEYSQFPTPNVLKRAVSKHV